jgi:hypothetical protein
MCCALGIRADHPAMARSLDELRDIRLPPPPQGVDAGSAGAAGEWIVAALAIAALALAFALAFALVRRYRRRALRSALRDIAAAEAAFRARGDAVALAGVLSRVLRRHAALRHPGSVGLAGPAWLEFLDEHGPTGFVSGPGAHLADLPYAAPGKPCGELGPTIDLVRRWLHSNP